MKHRPRLCCCVLRSSRFMSSQLQSSSGSCLFQIICSLRGSQLCSTTCLHSCQTKSLPSLKNKKKNVLMLLRTRAVSATIQKADKAPRCHLLLLITEINGLHLQPWYNTFMCTSTSMCISKKSKTRRHVSVEMQTPLMYVMCRRYQLLFSGRHSSTADTSRIRWQSPTAILYWD